MQNKVWMPQGSTPGPWNVCFFPPGCSSINKYTEAYSVVSNMETPVCDLFKLNYPDYEVISYSNAKSNSHLIAAAPDMYEALQNLENDEGHIPPAAWDLVQRSLAKARGEARDG